MVRCLAGMSPYGLIPSFAMFLFLHFEHWHVYWPRGPSLIYINTRNGHESFRGQRLEATRVGGGGQSKSKTSRQSATIYLKSFGLRSMKIDWEHHRVVRSGSTAGTWSNLCAQVDHQTVCGDLKVISMEGLDGNGVIVRLANIANMVDLVAGKRHRQTCPQILAQILAHRLVRPPIRFREV